MRKGFLGGCQFLRGPLLVKTRPSCQTVLVVDDAAVLTMADAPELLGASVSVIVGTVA